MYESKKTAQMRLNPILPTTRQLAEWEQPIDKPMTSKRFAKKRRMERKHVRDRLLERPMIETLMGVIERNYIIKAMDQWWKLMETQPVEEKSQETTRSTELPGPKDGLRPAHQPFITYWC